MNRNHLQCQTENICFVNIFYNLQGFKIAQTPVKDNHSNTSLQNQIIPRVCQTTSKIPLQEHQQSFSPISKSLPMFLDHSCEVFFQDPASAPSSFQPGWPDGKRVECSRLEDDPIMTYSNIGLAFSLADSYFSQILRMQPASLDAGGIVGAQGYCQKVQDGLFPCPSLATVS